MSTDRQKTIKQEVRLSGKGLHTGRIVNLCLKPAEAGAGICFRRVDIPASPWIRAGIENILTEQQSGMPRCTTIGINGAMIHTVEHLMSALYGLGIDNVYIELDNSELPGLDGSGIEFLKAIKKAGVVELQQEREYVDIKEPIGVNSHGASIFVVPAKAFKISYTLDYHHPMLRSQFFSLEVTGDSFEREIAPCRTFCLEEEARELQKNGLGLGASYDNTLVVGTQGVINNQVRFPNEFARHKVLDFVGDLYLLGRPIRGEVFAIKSGHYLNLELLKRIDRQAREYAKKSTLPICEIDASQPLDIQAVRRILPHRYPFLLVDRILTIEKGKRAVGIKNVTINDNFFEGHFPSRPVMPGVLILEALAQTGGVVVLTNEDHHGKVALFMAADKVKFRKLVEPGDQLLLEVEVLKDKSRTALLRGQAKVAGEVVAEAEMLFSYTDASFLD